MRSFGPRSCSVHASRASWNTQSTACARNLDEAMMENFCCLSSATLLFFFHSIALFPAWKGNRPGAGWEIEANSSQVLGFPQGSLLTSTSELVSDSSACHLQHSAQKKCLNSILHGTLPHLSGTQKSSAQFKHLKGS